MTMTTAAGAVSPFSADKPAAAAAAEAMAAQVINKLAVLPEATAHRVPVDEPSAPDTPPTALHDFTQLPSASSASTSHQSHTSLSSTSSSIALPYVADDGCSVFFARVPPTKHDDEILDVFQQYGPVHSINLYRRWAASKSSKGCGIVTYSDPASADAAIAALHSQYFWPDAAATMVVEKVDLAKLRKDTGDRKTYSSSMLHGSVSCSLEVQASISSDGSCKDLLAQGVDIDATATNATTLQQQPARQQPEQRTTPPAPARTGQQKQASSRVLHVVPQPPPQQTKGRVASEQQQQLPVDGPPASPAWVDDGYPGAYPAYYGLNGAHMQYMMYPPGYCYPVPYPAHIATQYMWVPYMGSAPYGTHPGAHGYVSAAVPAPAAAAEADILAGGPSAAAGKSVSSSPCSRIDDRQHYQHGKVAGCASAAKTSHSSTMGQSAGYRRQQQQEYDDAPYPQFVDSGDQVLNAKQLTTCIKNCATADAIHFLVQQHIMDMNHIHVSAALGRLAVINASSQQNRTHNLQQQRLVISLVDRLVLRQLDKAKPFELCNSLSAAGKLGYKPPADQVQLMLRVFVDRLALAKPNEVCTMLSAAARMGQRVSHSEFQLMVGSVVKNIGDCAAKKAQELLRTVEHMGYILTAGHRQLVQTAAEEDNCQLRAGNGITKLTVGNRVG